MDETEEMLQESEKRYRTLFERTPVGHYRTTPDGRFLDANPALAEMLGYPDRETLLAVGAADLHLDPADRARWQALVEREGVVRNFEGQVRRRDGTIIWVKDTARAIRDAGGQVLYYEGSLEDITERVEAEEDLQRLKEFHENIVQSMAEGIAVEDAEGRFTFVNPAAAAMLGYTPEELVGEHWTSVIPPDQQPIVEEADERRARGESDRYEVELMRKDGTRRSVLVSGSPRFEEDRFAGTIAVFTDITAHKRAEEALTKERNLLRTLMDHLPDYVFVKDTESRFITTNAAHLRILGAESLDEVIGKTDFEFFPRALAEQYFRDEQDVIRSDQPLLNRVEQAVDQEGKGQWLLTTKVPLYDDAGSVVGLVGISRDITERMQAEEALRKVNRALETLSLCNEALVRATDESALLHEVCQIIVEAGGYRLAWVGFAEQNEQKTVHPVAQSGFEDGYLETIHITWADTEHGRGPTGTAIRTGAPAIAKNILTNPDFAPWREEATRRGYASSIALPLVAENRTFGALNVYAAEPDAFDIEEVDLLMDLADDLAYGITALRTRAEHRRAEAERIRLFAAEQSRRQELDSLYALSRQLVATDEIEAVFDSISCHTAESVHATFCRLVLLEDGAFACRAAYPLRVLEFDLRVGRAEPEVAWPHYQRAIEGNQPLVLERDDPTLNLEECEALLLDAVRSLCLAPLRASDEIIGVMILGESRSPAREPFDTNKLRLVAAMADQAASALHRASLFSTMREHAEMMGRLVPISETLNRPLTMDEVVAAIGKSTLALSAADRAALYFREPDDTVTCLWSHALSTAYLEQVTARAQEMPGGRLLEQTEPVFVGDTEQVPADSLVRGLAKAEGYRALSMWPLVYEGQTVAAVGCYYDAPHSWSEVEQEVMEVFARQAAVALENARLYEDLEEAYVETVLALSNAVDARDAYTADHSQRLAEWATVTAQEMGCSEEEIETLRWATLLHDIGKIGIPDRVLLKPDSLNNEERATMELHPEIGEQIVSPVKKLAGVAPIIRAHQERWGGAGYPDGLSGGAIPLTARILAVVDAYGAMTEDRVYRKALSHEEAVAELKHCAGTQFDPRVVEAFLHVLDELRD